MSEFRVAFWVLSRVRQPWFNNVAQAFTSPRVFLRQVHYLKKNHTPSDVFPEATKRLELEVNNRHSILLLEF